MGFIRQGGKPDNCKATVMNKAMELLQEALRQDDDHVEIAESKAAESLAMLRQLSDGSTGRRDELYARMAAALLYLATLHHRLSRNAEAELKCEEALKIFRNLAVAASGFDEPIALALNVLGDLHTDTLRDGGVDNKLAEREYAESIGIYRSLATAKPDEFECEVARILRKLSCVHCETGRTDEGWREYAESAKLFRKLGIKEEC